MKESETPEPEDSPPEWGVDADAFEDLFREHYQGLCTFVRRYVEDMALAEELVQETFLTLWKRRRRLTLRSSIRSYLYASARNAALNHLKHRGVVERHASEAGRATTPSAIRTDEGVRQAELAEAIEKAVADLPEKARLVLTMSREGGLTYAEIADALGVSVKAVEANLSRALRILRDRLSEFMDRGERT